MINAEYIYNFMTLQDASNKSPDASKSDEVTSIRELEHNAATCDFQQCGIL